jgi:hypothetical protein
MSGASARIKQRRELFEILRNRFDEEELRTLCFGLSIDYDDLPSEGRSAKARELIAYMERHDRLDRLVQVLGEIRPDLEKTLELARPHVADLPLEPLFAHRFPSQLDWAGRAQELDHLTSFWKDLPYRVMAIVGLGGIGKSALVRRWYDEFTLRNIRPDGFFWWSFYTQPDVDAFLTRALAYLTGGRYQRLLAPSIEAMVEDLISLSAEGRFLFVLDGLEIMQQTPPEEYRPAQIKDRNLHNLLTRWADPKVHDGRCLITSRFTLPDLGSRTLALAKRPLSLEESCSLLRKRGVTGSDDDLAWLTTPYSGHPDSLSRLADFLIHNHKGNSQDPLVQAIFGPINGALACTSLEAVADWGDSLNTTTLNVVDWLGFKDKEDISTVVVTSSAAEWIRIGHLVDAAKAIKLYQERFQRQEREALLYDALRTIARIGDVQSDISSPFLFPITRIVTHWRDLIDAALEALRGEVKLKFRFVSDQAAFGETTDLALQVTNVGDETAEELNLFVVDTSTYLVVQAGPNQKYLSSGQSLIWEFSLRFAENRPTDVVIDANYRQRGAEETQVAEFADVITLQDPRRFQFVPFPRHSNPYNPGPPVKTDDMLYGRESLVGKIIDESRGLHQDNIIVLYGQRRTGKTSLLYALQRHLAGDAVYLPVFFDVQGCTTSLSLFWGLAMAIADACRGAGLDVIEPRKADFEADAQAQFEHGFLRPLADRLVHREGRRLILMLDEFESLEEYVKTLGTGIFPFFRHLMQHQPGLSFIFCGSHQLHELTRDYWSIFFNAARPIHVSFLDEAPTRALITEPVAGHFSYDELALRRLWALTRGHAYFTQYLCYEMVKLMSEREKGYATVQDVNDALDHFIKQGNDHLDYVWQRSSEAEQAALLALLDVRQAVGERAATCDHVARRVTQVHPPATEDIGTALEQLAKQELLWEDTGRVGFTMELVAQWLKVKHSWHDLTGQFTWPGV